MKIKELLKRFTKLMVTLSFLMITTITLSSYLFAQQGSSINGMVFDSDKRGITDVDVELLNEYSQLISRTRTTGGRFTFRGLSRGAYLVRVVPGKFGYSEQSQGVELISFNRGGGGLSNDTVHLDFYLQRSKPFSFAEAAGITNTVFAQDAPDSALQFYKQAIRDFDRNQNDSAFENLKKAIEILPTYFLALDRLGEELVRREDFKLAQDVLTKAIGINSKAATSFFLLGYSQYKTKQYQPAIVSLRQAITWSPKSANAFLYLGMSLRQIAKYNEAENQMLKAKEFGKKRLPEVHYQLALLYTNNLKKYNEAANELELYLKIQSNNKETEAIKKLIKQLRDKAKQGV